MNLYEVAHWGNDADGPNGPDMCYLVAATDEMEAVRLAEYELQFDSTKQPAYASLVQLLGTWDGKTQDGPIVFRRYVAHAFGYGVKSWKRHEPGDEWEVRPRDC